MNFFDVGIGVSYGWITAQVMFGLPEWLVGYGLVIALIAFVGKVCYRDLFAMNSPSDMDL